MTDALPDEPPALRPPWSVPEIVVVGILSAFGAVAVGGLAAGIDVAANQNAFGPVIDPFVQTWQSITFGAAWAGPVFASVLLGLVGICWWQADRWSEDAEDPAARADVAVAYIQRARRLCRWVVVALGVTALGAIADLIAAIGLMGLEHGNPISWTRVIPAIAGALAVVIISAVGTAVARETIR